ncbi:MAG: hypothetical protein JWL85_157 [Candidatus Saccharibacteria bacterium]|nr:hypothetical protein [Candidatus Saccharibacteria bacterium]
MSGNSTRGFASMDEETRKAVAAKGGRNSGGNFKRNPERARAAAQKRNAR